MQAIEIYVNMINIGLLMQLSTWGFLEADLKGGALWQSFLLLWLAAITPILSRELFRTATIVPKKLYVARYP